MSTNPNTITRTRIPSAVASDELLAIGERKLLRRVVSTVPSTFVFGPCKGYQYDPIGDKFRSSITPGDNGERNDGGKRSTSATAPSRFYLTGSKFERSSAAFSRPDFNSAPKISLFIVLDRVS